MPWKASEATRFSKKADTPQKQRVWSEVANRELERSRQDGLSTEEAEARAIRVANAAVARIGKSGVVSPASLSAVGMRVTKANQTGDGTMVWSATVSTAEKDLAGDVVTPSIMDDFVANFATVKAYLDPAHFSMFVPRSQSIFAGEVTHLWRDGNYLKAKGVFYDTPVGRAAFNVLKSDVAAKRGSIRPSIGFQPDWDLAEFSDEGLTFHGEGGKGKSWVHHIALTSVPMNEAVSPFGLGVMMKGNVITLEQDLLAVLGDADLVAELVEARKSALASKSLVEDENLSLVLRSDFDDADEQEIAVVWGEDRDGEALVVDAIVTRSVTNADKEKQKKRSRACGIEIMQNGNVTMPLRWKSEGVPDREDMWGDWTNYRYPLHKPDYVRNAISRLDGSRGQETCGFTVEEWSTIKGRVQQRAQALGLEDLRQPASTIDSLKQVYKSVVQRVRENAEPFALDVLEDLAEDYAEAVARAVHPGKTDAKDADEDAKDAKKKKERKSQTEDDMGDMKDVVDQLQVDPQSRDGTNGVEPEPVTKSETQPAEPATSPASPYDRARAAAKSFTDIANQFLTGDVSKSQARAGIKEAMVKTAAEIDSALAEPVGDDRLSRLEASVERLAQMMEVVGKSLTATGTTQVNDPRQEIEARRKSVAINIGKSAVLTEESSMTDVVNELIRRGMMR